MTNNLIIIGSGPAGLTAAIYAARADLSPIVIEGFQIGGQLTITTEVENYPGFPEGIMGPRLMLMMKEQAEKFGTKFIRGDATSIDLTSTPFKIFTEDQVVEAKSIIIATGASANLLNIESEKRLMGRGVSACATCDGFFFKDKEIAVVGGGDTAIEEATFLTKFAKSVVVIHRRDKLRASKIMQDKAFNNKKITFIWDSAVEEVLGDDVIKGIRLRNLKTNEVVDKNIEGLFIAIGHTPNTQLFKGKLDLDEKGYIITKNGTETSVTGVFAAGDVKDHKYRQAVTAAGNGCMAALDAERYLESN